MQRGGALTAPPKVELRTHLSLPPPSISFLGLSPAFPHSPSWGLWNPFPHPMTQIRCGSGSPLHRPHHCPQGDAPRAFIVAKLPLARKCVAFEVEAGGGKSHRKFLPVHLTLKNCHENLPLATKPPKVPFGSFSDHETVSGSFMSQMVFN